MSEMLRPRPDQLATLSPFERVAFEISDQVNRRPVLKRAAHGFLKTVGAAWVDVCTRNLRHVYGVEHIRSLDPDRGVIVCSNHRSFFDLYVMSSVLLHSTSWVERMYFPVRSNYFYERPDGIVVNAIMSAMAMYPPVMRKPEARVFNEYTVDVLAELLKKPGTVVGMHPEGTRNKTDDPYTLLPAQIGIGQMVHKSRAIVLPVFVLGLTNDIAKQVRGNFDGTGEPITLMFGKPLELQEMYDEAPRLRTYKKISDFLRTELTELGRAERAIRKVEGLPDLGPATRSSPDASSSDRR